jgi:hypothetical protein
MNRPCYLGKTYKVWFYGDICNLRPSGRGTCVSCFAKFSVTTSPVLKYKHTCNRTALILPRQLKRMCARLSRQPLVLRKCQCGYKDEITTGDIWLLPRSRVVLDPASGTEARMGKYPDPVEIICPKCVKSNVVFERCGCCRQIIRAGWSVSAPVLKIGTCTECQVVPQPREPVDLNPELSAPSFTDNFTECVACSGRATTRVLNTVRTIPKVWVNVCDGCVYDCRWCGVKYLESCLVCSLPTIPPNIDPPTTTVI